MKNLLMFVWRLLRNIDYGEKYIKKKCYNSIYFKDIYQIVSYGEMFFLVF